MYFPLSASCKKQGCVSGSTCEAEVVAVSLGQRHEGLFVLAMWQALSEASAPPTLPQRAGGNGAIVPNAVIKKRPCRSVRGDAAAPSA